MCFNPRPWHLPISNQVKSTAEQWLCHSLGDAALYAVSGNLYQIFQTNVSNICLTADHMILTRKSDTPVTFQDQFVELIKG